MRDELTQLRAEDVTHSIAVIGDNFKRAELAQLLVQSNFKFVTMIHPTAACVRGIRIGAGTVILPCAYIGADVSNGDTVIVSDASVMGHDCVIGNSAHLGANTHGLDDLPDDVRAVGSPARIIKSHIPEYSEKTS